jgi:hypothetical protein
MKSLKSILLMTLFLVSITIKAGPVDQLTKVGTYCFELYETTSITSSLLLTVYSDGTNNYFPVYGIHTALASTPVYGNAIIDNKRNQATVSITTSSTSIYLAVYTLFLNLNKNLSGVYQRIYYVQLRTVQAGGFGYDLGFDSGSVVMKNSCEQ